jgi:hypothetical protein
MLQYFHVRQPPRALLGQRRRGGGTLIWMHESSTSSKRSVQKGCLSHGMVHKWRQQKQPSHSQFQCSARLVWDSCIWRTVTQVTHLHLSKDTSWFSKETDKLTAIHYSIREEMKLCIYAYKKCR